MELSLQKNIRVEETAGDQIAFAQIGGRDWIRTSDPALIKRML